MKGIKITVIVISIIALILGGYYCFYNNNKEDEIINVNFTGNLSGPINESDFYLDLLGGIGIGQKFSDFEINKLGKPIEIRKEAADGDNRIIYRYSDYEIVVSDCSDPSDNSIQELRIYKEGLKTNRGLMVGDDFNQIIEKYGPKNVIKEFNSNIYSIEFKNKQELDYPNHSILFIIRDQRIRMISIF